jgi:hypothetical protein
MWHQLQRLKDAVQNEMLAVIKVLRNSERQSPQLTTNLSLNVRRRSPHFGNFIATFPVCVHVHSINIVNYV